MPLSALRESYSEVEDSARTLLRLAVQGPPGEALLEARKQMAQAVARSVTLRDRLMIAPLRASPDPTHRACASRLVDRGLQSRLRAIEHNAEWTVRAIAADPAGYRATMEGALREIQARIAEEVATIHPLVLAARTAAPHKE